MHIHILCVYIDIIHTANLIVVPRNKVILLSFGCCVSFFETLPSVLDRHQRFVRDVLGQSFRELLPWDNVAKIIADSFPHRCAHLAFVHSWPCLCSHTLRTPRVKMTLQPRTSRFLYPWCWACVHFSSDLSRRCRCDISKIYEMSQAPGACP